MPNGIEEICSSAFFNCSNCTWLYYSKQQIYWFNYSKRRIYTNTGTMPKPLMNFAVIEKLSLNKPISLL